MEASASMPYKWPAPFFSNARRICSVLPPPSQVPTFRATCGFWGALRMVLAMKPRSAAFNWPSITFGGFAEFSSITIWRGLQTSLLSGGQIPTHISNFIRHRTFLTEPRWYGHDVPPTNQQDGEWNKFISFSRPLGFFKGRAKVKLGFRT